MGVRVGVGIPGVELPVVPAASQVQYGGGASKVYSISVFPAVSSLSCPQLSLLLLLLLELLLLLLLLSDLLLLQMMFVCDCSRGRLPRLGFRGVGLRGGILELSISVL